jgi:hypothetical protein
MMFVFFYKFILYNTIVLQAKALILLLILLLLAGNGNAIGSGVRPFDQTPINTITINSSVTREVNGSYAIWANIKVSGNIVNVTPLDNIRRNIYGGRTCRGTVLNNVVNYYDAAIGMFGEDIYYIDNNGKGLDNIVNINEANRNIYGVYGCQVQKAME